MRWLAVIFVLVSCLGAGAALTSGVCLANGIPFVCVEEDPIESTPLTGCENSISQSAFRDCDSEPQPEGCEELGMWEPEVSRDQTGRPIFFIQDTSNAAAYKAKLAILYQTESGAGAPYDGVKMLDTINEAPFDSECNPPNGPSTELRCFNGSSAIWEEDLGEDQIRLHLFFTSYRSVSEEDTTADANVWEAKQTVVESEPQWDESGLPMFDEPEILAAPPSPGLPVNTAQGNEYGVTVSSDGKTLIYIVMARFGRSGINWPSTYPTTMFNRIFAATREDTSEPFEELPAEESGVYDLNLWALEGTPPNLLGGTFWGVHLSKQASGNGQDNLYFNNSLEVYRALAEDYPPYAYKYYDPANIEKIEWIQTCEASTIWPVDGTIYNHHVCGTLGCDSRGGIERSLCPEPPSGDDSDNDGVPDDCDNCAAVQNGDQLWDWAESPQSDGLGDVCDNCTSGYNPGQDDDDVDTVGPPCDCDDDPSDDPSPGTYNCTAYPSCTQCTCSSSDTGDCRTFCARCAKCMNPEATENPNDSWDNDCDCGGGEAEYQSDCDGKCGTIVLDGEPTLTALGLNLTLYLWPAAVILILRRGKRKAVP